MFYYSYITDKGKKQVDQDALMIKTARYQNADVLMAAVCDGIGGLSHGEIASSSVVEGLSRWFETQYAAHLKAEDNVLTIRQSLDDRLQGLNDAINQCCRDGASMGTTCTAVLADPQKDLLLIAHVGDTRLYRIREDSIEVVTQDHSVVAEEVRRGLITEEQARTDERQNQITNCIGAGENGRVYDYLFQRPEEQCTYLLCTDGFRKMVDPEELQAHLRPQDVTDAEMLHQRLQALLELDLMRDETDNITAVAFAYVKGN